MPTCTQAQFTANECPVDSQVGISDQYVLLGGEPEGGAGELFSPRRPVYNMVPQPGQAGVQAFLVGILSFPIYTVLSARTGTDYGLNAEVKGITTSIPLKKFTEELWGVPPAPVHDDNRATPGPFPGIESYPTPSSSPEKPYLTNPTSCVGPIDATFTDVSPPTTASMKKASPGLRRPAATS